MLAAYFAARVLRAGLLTPGEKVSLLLKLTVRAVDEATVLDTVLGRLLLVLQPSYEASIAQYEPLLERYAPPPATAAPAFEPLV